MILKELDEQYLQYSEEPGKLVALLKMLHIEANCSGSKETETRKTYSTITAKRISFTGKAKPKYNLIDKNSGKIIAEIKSYPYELTAKIQEFRENLSFEKHYCYEIFIKRGEKEIRFNYFGSIADFNKEKMFGKDLLYAILCCVGSEYHIADDFNEFCGDFGYDNDSIKDKELYNKCLEQSSKLKQIFTEEEISYMPS